MVKEIVKSFWTHVFEKTKNLASLFISLGVVWGVLAFIFVNFFLEPVQDFSRSFVGTDEIIISMYSLVERQEVTNSEIKELFRRINNLEPRPSVSEYDALRSYINGPCHPGEGCDWYIRSKRTEFGNTCSAPVVIGRYFTDFVGNRYSVNEIGDSLPSQKGDTWSISHNAFIVDPMTSEGVGEFFLVLRYEECGSGEEIIIEPTIPLKVEIVEK